MFEDIRLGYGLSRNQLATLTGRSVNYLLKAEQCTFPSPPVALLAFYTNPTPPDVQQFQRFRLQQDWEPYDRDTLMDAYYAKQRHKREAWLDSWLPVTNMKTVFWPLQQKWMPNTGAPPYGASAVGHFGGLGGVYPNSYQLSVGLCIPASVVYRNEKNPQAQSNAIRAAMGTLVEYVESGRFLAANLSAVDAQRIELAVIRIAEEEGWKKPAETSQQQHSQAS